MKSQIDKPTFSQNLIRLRKERGLSQQELANLSGLTQRMIVYYEKEATKPPIDKIETIAKALNVSINELLSTDDLTSKTQGEFSQLDSRTIKKLKLILSLSEHDRSIIYSIAETFSKKSKKNKVKDSENQD